jgi:hypothetical protein
VNIQKKLKQIGWELKVNRFRSGYLLWPDPEAVILLSATKRMFPRTYKSQGLTVKASSHSISPALSVKTLDSTPLMGNYGRNRSILLWGLRA